jgi:hypothetical protein
MKIEENARFIIMDLCYAVYFENSSILEFIEEKCEVTFDDFFSPENRHKLGCMNVFKEVDNESNDVSKASYLAYHYLRINGAQEKTLKVVESLKEKALESDPHYKKLVNDWGKSRSDEQDRFLKESYDYQQAKAAASGRMA